MEIKIETTKQDWVAFYLTQLFRDKKNRGGLLMKALLPPIIFIALALVVVFQIGPGYWRTAGLWLSFLSLPVYGSHFYFTTKRKLSRQVAGFIQTGQCVVGNSEIVLSQEGVSVNRDSKPTFKSWKEITRVTADGNYGFIFAGPDNITIIPCRYFPDHTSFEMFVKNAVIFQWHAENAAKEAAVVSRQSPPPPPLELKPLVISM